MTRFTRHTPICIVIVGALILAGCGGSDDTGGSTPPEQINVETIQPTETPEPTDLPPTWTPIPTNTPAPTSTPIVITPRPTSTPITAPIATPLVQDSGSESGSDTGNDTSDDTSGDTGADTGDAAVSQPTIPPENTEAAATTVFPTPEGNRIDLAPITAANADRIALIQAEDRILAADLVIAPDGTQLAAAMQDGVYLFTHANLSLAPQVLPDSGNVFGFTVEAVAYSPDGSQLASGNAAGELVIWDLATAERLFTIPAYVSPLWDVLYSPDGTRIVTGGDHGGIKVWDATTGTLVSEVEVDDAVYDLAAYPLSGLVVAAGVSTSRAKVWNLTNGEELAPLSGHSSETRAVAFSPDGETLASGGDEGSVRIWTVAGAQAGEPEAVLGGHNNTISVLAYSPDSSLMAVGTTAGSLAIWDLAANEKLFEAQAHIPWVNAIVWLPDQSALITSGKDSTVRVWGVPAQ